FFGRYLCRYRLHCWCSLCNFDLGLADFQLASYRRVDIASVFRSLPTLRDRPIVHLQSAQLAGIGSSRALGACYADGSCAANLWSTGRPPGPCLYLEAVNNGEPLLRGGVVRRPSLVAA